MTNNSSVKNSIHFPSTTDTVYMDTIVLCPISATETKTPNPSKEIYVTKN